MKPAPFAYHDPRSLEEAVALIGALENARVLAGGQSLVPMLNLRVAAPDHLIDLNRVPGLAGIAIEHGRARLGAMTRQRAVERSADLATAAPILAEALHHVGHPPTRNRGTIGGSLSHLDPAAELPATMMLLDATLTAQSARGRRAIPIADFARDLMTTDLEHDEILTEIAFDAWPAGHGHAFLEIARRHGDFAIVSAGALIACGADGRIARAALVIGGMGPVPQRCRAAEEALVGEKPDTAPFAAAAEETRRLEAMTDHHVDSAYRRQVAPVLARRTLARAAARCHAGGAA